MPELSVVMRPVTDAAGNKICQDSSTDWARNPKCFYGDLAGVMDVIERHSASLDQRATNDINRTAAFNAVLPIGGSILLYRRIRGLPHSGLLFPSAVAAGTYAALTGGIPDIHAQYRESARQLRCTSLRYSVWLYRNDEILGEGSNRKTSLTRIQENLKLAIASYSFGRKKLQAELRPYVKQTGTEAANAFQRAQGVGTASTRRDTRDRILAIYQDRLAIARQTLDAITDLLDQIDRSAGELETEAAFVAPELIDVLGKLQPAEKDPQTVGAGLKAKILAMAQASDSVPDSRMTAALSSELRDGVQSTQQLDSFSMFEEEELYLAWNAGRNVLRNHLANEQRMRELAARNKCKLSTTATAAPETPAPANGTGSTGGTPATNGGTTTTPLQPAG